jgi:hypothetical protein
MPSPDQEYPVNAPEDRQLTGDTRAQGSDCLCNFVQNIVNFSGIVDHSLQILTIIAVADDRVSNKRAGFAVCSPQRLQLRG